MQIKDHPIYEESIRHIKSELGNTGLEPLQQNILERLIHTSGDFSIKSLLSFSPGACENGVQALRKGATILTDTAMAASAVIPMARRTLNSSVTCILDWAPQHLQDTDLTRSAIGMNKALDELLGASHLAAPIVLIGSAPTALNVVLDKIEKGFSKPSLIIGMPVGFVGVAESKKRLLNSSNPQIVLNGSRGGAAMAAATINTLLRASI